MPGIPHKIVYVLGGSGTYSRRAFVHRGCITTPYQNHRGETITTQEFNREYARVVPLVDLDGFVCAICDHTMMEG